MHDHDFQLLQTENLPGGGRRLLVRVNAMNLDRWYEVDAATGSLRLADDPIRVAGHDMTSITGKRVREWLRSIDELG